MSTISYHLIIFFNFKQEFFIKNRFSTKMLDWQFHWFATGLLTCSTISLFCCISPWIDNYHDTNLSLHSTIWNHWFAINFINNKWWSAIIDQNNIQRYLIQIYELCGYRPPVYPQTIIIVIIIIILCGYTFIKVFYQVLRISS